MLRALLRAYHGLLTTGAQDRKKTSKKKPKVLAIAEEETSKDIAIKHRTAPKALPVTGDLKTPRIPADIYVVVYRPTTPSEERYEHVTVGTRTATTLSVVYRFPTATRDPTLHFQKDKAKGMWVFERNTSTDEKIKDAQKYKDMLIPVQDVQLLSWQSYYDRWRMDARMSGEIAVEKNKDGRVETYHQRFQSIHAEFVEEGKEKNDKTKLPLRETLIESLPFFEWRDEATLLQDLEGPVFGRHDPETLFFPFYLQFQIVVFLKYGTSPSAALKTEPVACIGFLRPDEAVLLDPFNSSGKNMEVKTLKLNKQQQQFAGTGLFIPSDQIFSLTMVMYEDLYNETVTLVKNHERLWAWEGDFFSIDRIVGRLFTDIKCPWTRTLRRQSQKSKPLYFERHLSDLKKALAKAKLYNSSAYFHDVDSSHLFIEKGMLHKTATEHYRYGLFVQWMSSTNAMLTLGDLNCFELWRPDVDDEYVDANDTDLPFPKRSRELYDRVLLEWTTTFESTTRRKKDMEECLGSLFNACRVLIEAKNPHQGSLATLGLFPLDLESVVFEQEDKESEFNVTLNAFELVAPKPFVKKESASQKRDALVHDAWQKCLNELTTAMRGRDLVVAPAAKADDSVKLLCDELANFQTHLKDQQTWRTVSITSRQKAIDVQLAAAQKQLQLVSAGKYDDPEIKKGDIKAAQATIKSIQYASDRLKEEEKETQAFVAKIQQEIQDYEGIVDQLKGRTTSSREEFFVDTARMVRSYHSLRKDTEKAYRRSRPYQDNKEEKLQDVDYEEDVMYILNENNDKSLHSRSSLLLGDYEWLDQLNTRVNPQSFFVDGISQVEFRFSSQFFDDDTMDLDVPVGERFHWRMVSLNVMRVFATLWALGFKACDIATELIKAKRKDSDKHETKYVALTFTYVSQ
jgi:hypothetical protein